MEKIAGMNIYVKGSSNMQEFAIATLLLTNLKSNNIGIIDFKTFDSSNDINIKMTKEFYDKEIGKLISQIGSITSKQEAIFYCIEEDDLQDTVLDAFIKQNDTYLDDETDTELEPFFYLIN